MSSRSRTALEARPAALWMRRAFWDEVEVEIEAPDPLDLLEFLEADRLALPCDPAFESGLRSDLRRLVVRRYAQ